MICKSEQCGKEIPNNSIYCPSCGHIVGNQPHKVIDVIYRSGISEFNENTRINLIFSRHDVEFQEKPKLSFLTNKLHEPKYVLSIDNIKSVKFYGSTGTTAINTANGEIVLSERQFRLYEIFSQLSNIPSDTVDEIKSPPSDAPDLLKFVCISLILLSLFGLKRFFNNVGKIDFSDNASFVLGFFLSLPTFILLILSCYKILRGRKWASYCAQVLLAFFILIAYLEFKLSLLGILIIIIISIVIFYLNTRKVKDYLRDKN